MSRTYRSVSIPLRGRCNVNLKEDEDTAMNIIRFPSPCGEDVMSTGSLMSEDGKGFVWFPSPCGEDVMSTKNYQLA